MTRRCHLVFFFLPLIVIMLAGCVSKNEKLLKACMGARFDEARLLLKEGANPAYKDKHGVTPLFLSVRNDNVSMVKQLIDAGADPNDWLNGYNPLCEAASSRNPEMWRLLIAAGANVNASNSAGWTPLKSAISAQNVEFTELLISKGTDVNASSYLYCALGNGKLTKLLIEAGAKVNVADAQGRTPLHCVSCPQSANLLIEAGANINAISSGQDTPLDAARARLREWKTYDDTVHGVYRSKKDVEQSCANQEGIIEILRSHGASSYAELK